MKKEGNKNSVIELIRFFAISVIVFFHIEIYYFNKPLHFNYGYIFVEFFFIISGFFAMMNISKKDNFSGFEIVKMLWHKFKSIYPKYLAAFALSFIIIVIYIQKTNISEIFQKLINYKWEIFGLHFSGFIQGENWEKVLNIPAWYISSLIISFAVFVILATKFKKAFIYLIAPISILLTYSTFINQFGTLDLNIQLTNIFGFIINTGNMRAFAGMSLGAICYYIYLKIREDENNKKTKVIFTFVEVFLYCSILYLLKFNELLNNEDMVFYIFIFAVLVIIEFSKKGYIATFCSRVFNKIPIYLGDLSLYMFLFQYPVILLYKEDFSDIGYFKGMLIIYISIFVISVLIKSVFEIVKRIKK